VSLRGVYMNNKRKMKKKIKESENMYKKKELTK
jgi:hypothetical protein